MRLRGMVAGFLVVLVCAGNVHSQTAGIVNGGFEQAFTGWTRSGSFHVSFVLKAYRGKGVAASGVTSAGRPDFLTNGTLAQTVKLPQTPLYRFLFRVSIATAETGSVARDTLAVEILDSFGKLLATPLTLSNVDKTAGYVQQTVSLEAYRNKTIRVQFRTRSNGTHATTFLIDDVALDPVQAPTTIRGRVKNGATGAGVKATVSFGGKTATSLADGAYELANVTCAPGRLKASAPGLQTYDRQFTPQCGVVNQMDILLTPPPTNLTGRVRDIPTAAPLANITVNLTGAAPQRTATDGTFSFANIPCAPATLSVNAPGYKPFREDIIPRCAATTDREIALDPNRTALFGTVTDLETGQGLAGAEGSLGGRPTVTDERGLFVLTSIQCDATTLTISAPGYEPYSVPYKPLCGETNLETVRLRPYLTTITGRIAHEVSGAPLQASVSDGSRSVATNSSGEYTLTTTCSRMNLKVTADGYRPAEVYYRPQCGTENTLDFELLPLPTGTSVCGTVRYAGGIEFGPVPGVKVELGTRSDVTDQYGTYCLASVPCPAGEVSMIASKDGFRDALKQKVRVTCGAVTSVDFLILEQHIEGSVTDGSTGIPPAPIANANLTLGNATTTSGLKGEFRFRKLCGPGALKVTAAGYHPTTVQINPDCRSLVPNADVKLQPSGTNLLVRLTDHKAKGIDRNLVVVWGATLGIPAGDGYYSFPKVLCGESAPLTVFSMRYEPLRTRVSAGCNTTTSHPHGLTPIRTTLTGEVRDGIAGGNLAGATVTWQGRTAETAASGRFGIQYAACGRGTLTVGKSGFATKTVDLTVSCDAESYFVQTPITLTR